MASSASSSSCLRVPAPQRTVAVAVALLLVLVLLRAPSGGASRPLREGTSNDGGAAATVPRVRALDRGHHRARESGVATAAAARRATTVGGGAPTPPSGPSQNHN